MREKDFQTAFNRWCKYKYQGSGVFELKLVKGRSLPFNALEEHQKRALFLTQTSQIIHKIPDAGYQNPFDSFKLEKIPAWVVVMFYERGKKDFYLVSIDAWIEEEKSSPRKSLTEDRAKIIGTLGTLQ